MSSFYQSFVIYISANNDSGWIKVITQSLGLSQKFRAENDILASYLFMNILSISTRIVNLITIMSFRLYFITRSMISSTALVSKKFFLKLVDATMTTKSASLYANSESNVAVLSGKVPFQQSIS